MKLDLEKRGPVTIVCLEGPMGAGADRSWVEPVQNLLDNADARVILDMRRVDYISSAGLGDLVRVTAQANSQGARFVLAELTPFVAGVLKTTRLDRFFEHHPSIEAAVSAVAPHDDPEPKR